MALHNLKITVVDGGKGSGAFGSGKEIDPEKATLEKWKKSPLYKIINYNQTVKAKIKKATTPTQMLAIQAGINIAVQTGRQFINYYVSDYGRRYGDSNYQAVVNRRVEQATDVLGLAGSALGGAAAGSMFGPVGALVGAAAGAIATSINIGFRQMGREREYQHELFKDSVSQAYNLARVGEYALTGRLR